MIPVLLLARSFVRQNRWLLLVFVLWPFVLGAFVWSPHHPPVSADVLEIVQQETLYGLVIVMFLATSAIHNERRSRRIVGVLSKGITRLHYLLGFLVGAAWFAAVYFAMIDISVLWLVGRSVPMQGELTLWIEGVVASLWIVALGLLISTFGHPFFSATVTGTATFLPLIFSPLHPLAVPAAALIRNATAFTKMLDGKATCVALVEAAVFLFAGSVIFQRRDVAVNLE